jgi:hypothetical protein
MKNTLRITLLSILISSCLFPKPKQSESNMEGTWKSLIDSNKTINIYQGSITWTSHPEQASIVTHYFDISEEYIQIPEPFINQEGQAGKFELLRKGLLYLHYSDYGNKSIGFIRK